MKNRLLVVSWVEDVPSASNDDDKKSMTPTDDREQISAECFVRYLLLTPDNQEKVMLLLKANELTLARAVLEETAPRDVREDVLGAMDAIRRSEVFLCAGSASISVFTSKRDADAINGFLSQEKFGAKTAFSALAFSTKRAEMAIHLLNMGNKSPDVFAFSTPARSCGKSPNAQSYMFTIYSVNTYSLREGPFTFNKRTASFMDLTRRSIGESASFILRYVSDQDGFLVEPNTHCVASEFVNRSQGRFYLKDEDVRVYSTTKDCYFVLMVLDEYLNDVLVQLFEERLKEKGVPYERICQPIIPTRIRTPRKRASSTHTGQESPAGSDRFPTWFLDTENSGAQKTRVPRGREDDSKVPIHIRNLTTSWTANAVCGDIRVWAGEDQPLVWTSPTDFHSKVSILRHWGVSDEEVESVIKASERADKSACAWCVCKRVVTDGYDTDDDDVLIFPHSEPEG